MNLLDRAIGFFSPTWGLKRAHARKVLRTYQGAESNRLTGSKKPQNKAADSELMGPFGADAARAWARSFVRDNPYACGIVETIATAVIATGIEAQSMVETVEGDDAEAINEARDKSWSEWCEVCDINNELTFTEMQFLAVREIAEAGEVLIRMRPVKKEGRPVPLALEMIDADRLALDRDTWAYERTGNRVIRGVEMDASGKPIAYWIYPEHPNSPYINAMREPVRVKAEEIIHLYRKDRVGQSRGVTWFAPVLSPLRDLGVYIDNELQASAVASCFTAVIKTNGSAGSLLPTDGSDTVDSAGNYLEHLEPALVARLNPDESLEIVNPARPAAQAAPWINLMVRNIGVGVGLGYEKVSRDYSGTSYSSARTAELEDRRRFKRFQKYIITHLCQRVWDRFCEAAATVDKMTDGPAQFPLLSDLLEERRALTPVDWQVPEWEWVDPQNEQAASVMAIQNNMSTLQRECAKIGINWRKNLKQRSKEVQAEKDYGVQSLDAQSIDAEVAAAGQQNSNDASATNGADPLQSQALNGAQVTSLVEIITAVGTGGLPQDTAKALILASFPLIQQSQIDAIINPIKPGSITADGVPAANTAEQSGEYMGLSTLQWNRNRKAIQKILDELTSGVTSEAAARVFLASLGMREESISALITDAMDGSAVNLPPEAAETPAQ